MKQVLTKTEERMQRRINHLESEYKAIRAGRANPAVLDKVKVDYYGTPTPVNQVATVSVRSRATASDRSSITVTERSSRWARAATSLDT